MSKNNKGNKVANKSYTVVALCIVMVCMACQTKEDYPVMKDLQLSISKLSSVAERIDADTESLWAYSTADSIVKTMELNSESIWRDLARAYSALSYVGYGLSYTHSARSGDINKLFQLSKYIVKCNPDTIKPNKYLHLMELQSDRAFIFFYDVSHMDKTEGMKEVYQESMSFWNYIYMDKSKNNQLNPQGISNSFMEFQKENKDFLFIYAYMVGDLLYINHKSEEEFKKKRTELINIANEMDSLPSDWNNLISRQIALKAKLINMLSNEIQALQ